MPTLAWACSRGTVVLCGAGCHAVRCRVPCFCSQKHALAGFRHAGRLTPCAFALPAVGEGMLLQNSRSMAPRVGMLAGNCRSVRCRVPCFCSQKHALADFRYAGRLTSCAFALPAVGEGMLLQDSRSMRWQASGTLAACPHVSACCRRWGEGMLLQNSRSMAPGVGMFAGNCRPVWPRKRGHGTGQYWADGVLGGRHGGPGRAC